ncbi:MAG: outer membrane beta-barrel protein [Lewinellaceae bacterium]|nr:outer membrane beta-barrel protein [Saprospiraceae bacterium]MCB9338123.1 outer membrane beta-barrel protein [Lewinellaceae bacterium]
MPILLMGLTTIYTTIQAQSGIGFHFGNCYSKFHVVEGEGKFYDFSPDFDHKGFKAELYYCYAFNKYLKLKPSLGYIKRGAIIKRDYGWVGIDKFTLNYLDISANIDISPIEYFSINCGLNNNYLIKETSFLGKVRSSDGTEFYKRFDFGYELGATITIRNIFINASYFKSIKPIRVIDFISTIFPDAKNTEYRNCSIEVSIGYHFNLQKKKERS